MNITRNWALLQFGMNAVVIHQLFPHVGSPSVGKHFGALGTLDGFGSVSRQHVSLQGVV